MKNQIDSPKKGKGPLTFTVPADRKARLSEFKKLEIHNKISQVLIHNKIIETENPQAIPTLIMHGLNKACRSNETDFADFIEPIRTLVPRPNPYALYLTRYISEIIINDPNVIDVYGTDEEIYKLIDNTISRGLD